MDDNLIFLHDYNKQHLKSSNKPAIAKDILNILHLTQGKNKHSLASHISALVKEYTPRNKNGTIYWMAYLDQVIPQIKKTLSLWKYPEVNISLFDFESDIEKIGYDFKSTLLVTILDQPLFTIETVISIINGIPDNTNYKPISKLTMKHNNSFIERIANSLVNEFIESINLTSHEVKLDQYEPSKNTRIEFVNYTTRYKNNLELRSVILLPGSQYENIIIKPQKRRMKHVFSYFKIR